MHHREVIDMAEKTEPKVTFTITPIDRTGEVTQEEVATVLHEACPGEEIQATPWFDGAGVWVTASEEVHNAALRVAALHNWRVQAQSNPQQQLQ